MTLLRSYAFYEASSGHVLPFIIKGIFSINNKQQHDFYLCSLIIEKNSHRAVILLKVHYWCTLFNFYKHI